MKKYLSILLIFFLLFSVSVPAFASDFLPPVMSNFGTDSYIITQTETANGCFTYLSSDWTVFYQSAGVNGNSWPVLYFFSKVENPSTIYSTNKRFGYYDPENDNNGWELMAPVSVYTSTSSDGTVHYYWGGNFSNSSIIESSYDIYYGEISSDFTNFVLSDEVFFSAIPPLEVVTGEALTQFQTQTIQNLMIIALCGVGCLALLISLPILKKVLYQFLNR